MSLVHQCKIDTVQRHPINLRAPPVPIPPSKAVGRVDYVLVVRPLYRSFWRKKEKGKRKKEKGKRKGKGKGTGKEERKEGRRKKEGNKEGRKMKGKI